MKSKDEEEGKEVDAMSWIQKITTKLTKDIAINFSQRAISIYFFLIYYYENRLVNCGGIKIWATGEEKKRTLVIN